MLNINYGKNKSLLDACRPLKEYAWLISQIQKNREHMGIEDAVDKAISNMPEDFVTRPLLIGHRAEVKDMCITEYNEAETLQMTREEGRVIGLIEKVYKKLCKGQDATTIADALEEDISAIQKIIAAAEAYAPNYDVAKIYQMIESQKI